MRSFFDRLRFKMAAFMQGRYGMDALSKAMLIWAIVCGFLSNLPYLRFLYIAFTVLIVLIYVRCLSKNTSARRRELYKYYDIKNTIKDKYKLKKKIWNERKTHRYFKCPKCKALLRVPKGKGKIEVTCRVCKEKIIKRS